MQHDAALCGKRYLCDLAIGANLGGCPGCLLAPVSGLRTAGWLGWQSPGAQSMVSATLPGNSNSFPQWRAKSFGASGSLRGVRRMVSLIGGPIWLRSAAGCLKQVLPCGRQPVQAGFDPALPAGSAIHGFVMCLMQIARTQLRQRGDEEVCLCAIL